MTTFKKPFPGRLGLVASDLFFLVSFEDGEMFDAIAEYYRSLDGFKELQRKMGIRSEHDTVIAILLMYGLDAFRDPSGDLQYEYSGIDEDLGIFWRDIIKSNPRYKSHALYGVLPLIK